MLLLLSIRLVSVNEYVITQFPTPPAPPLPLKLRGGFLVLEIWTKRGIMKNYSEIGGQLKGGSSQKKGGFHIVSSVVLQKRIFSLLFDFFCLVNIHTCCNQQIYSFMWFTFYQKMIHYGWNFFSSYTLIFKYNFVKILLLITFSISISISLKPQIFSKINHRCLKEAIAQLLYRNDV